jgi:hypothetical protein
MDHLVHGRSLTGVYALGTENHLAALAAPGRN